MKTILPVHSWAGFNTETKSCLPSDSPWVRFQGIRQLGNFPMWIPLHHWWEWGGSFMARGQPAALLAHHRRNAWAHCRHRARAHHNAKATAAQCLFYRPAPSLFVVQSQVSIVRLTTRVRFFYISVIQQSLPSDFRDKLWVGLGLGVEIGRNFQTGMFTTFRL